MTWADESLCFNRLAVLLEGVVMRNWLFLFGVCLSSFAYSKSSDIHQSLYSKLFKNYNVCFILFDVNRQKIVKEYNPFNRCHQPISPDSTFKIPLSLMAFNQGIINQQTVFKWDGVTRALPAWNQDQTPKTWLQNSVLWVSQRITPQLGLQRIENYLAGFNYGNEDMSGDPKANNGLQVAWLSSSLKISAIEQLYFLNAMLKDELPVTKEAVENTKANMYLGKLDNGAHYYGKTGSGRNGKNERLNKPSKLRDGWFIGFVEDGDRRYIFISNLTDKAIQASIDKQTGALLPYGSQVLKPLTMELLNRFFSG